MLNCTFDWYSFRGVGFIVQKYHQAHIAPIHFHPVESGSAMLSSERISASMPNLISTRAAISIRIAANTYPPASAQGEVNPIRYPNSSGAAAPPIAVPKA